MKIKKSVSFESVTGEIIARFGKVNLMRKPDGRHVLAGGRADQRAAARQWCEQNAPFLAFEDFPQTSLAMAA